MISKEFAIRICERMKTWNEITKHWNIEEWKDYWINVINEKLSLAWNKQFYKRHKIEEINELLSFPILEKIPQLRIENVIAYQKTSGTTGKPKTIPLTLDDVILGFQSFRVIFNKINAFDRMLLIASSPHATSGVYFSIGAEIINLCGGKAQCLFIKQICEQKITPRFPVAKILTLLGHIFPALTHLPPEALAETVDLALTGSVLTKGIIKAIENKMKEKGVKLGKVVNCYAASEILGIAAISSDDIEILEQVPDPAIFFINIVEITQDGIKRTEKILPIWKAKKGDIGYIVVTSLRDLLLINYIGLWDLIQVVNPEFPPKFKVLGRAEAKVNLGYSKVLNKQLEGITGSTVKAGGQVLAMNAFHGVMSKLYPGVRYFVIIHDFGTSAIFEVYSDKEIDLTKTIKELSHIPSGFETPYNFQFKNIINRKFIDEVYEELIVHEIKQEKTPKLIKHIVIKHY